MKLRHSASRTAPRRVAGFTLIETMITTAIVAMLAMIAYPSFMQSIRNSNRSDAQAALARVSVNLERFFATNGTYTTNSALIGLQLNEGVASSDASHYTIGVAAGPTGIASSYVITATAAADSMQTHDEGCTVMSLDSQGRRLPDPNDSRCW
jgi:type IV pilus assembly protein PilE